MAAKPGRNPKNRWKALLEEMEALAGQLAFTVRYDSKIHAPGGACLVRGERLIVINSRLPENEQVYLLAQALRSEPLDAVYLRPDIRALMESLPSAAS